jgi:hypothetical protein
VYDDIQDINRAASRIPVLYVDGRAFDQVLTAFVTIECHGFVRQQISRNSESQKMLMQFIRTESKKFILILVDDIRDRTGRKAQTELSYDRMQSD